MDVTLSGISILAKLLQPEKACVPILFTPLPNFTFLRFTQPENAESPIRLTLSGIVIFAISVQLWNARSPISATPVPMATSHNAGQLSKAP